MSDVFSPTNDARKPTNDTTPIIGNLSPNSDTVVRKGLKVGKLKTFQDLYQGLCVKHVGDGAVLYFKTYQQRYCE